MSPSSAVRSLGAVDTRSASDTSEVRRARRQLERYAKRVAGRRRRRRWLDALPLPAWLLAGLGVVGLGGGYLVYVLDDNGTLSRHPGWANLLTSVVAGAFGVPFVAFVFTQAQQRQQVRQWAEFHTVVAVRIATYAHRLASVVARSLARDARWGLQRWVLTEGREFEPELTRTELVVTLFSIRAASDAFDAKRFAPVDVTKEASHAVVSAAAELGKQLELAFRDLERTPHYLRVGPTLHSLRDEVYEFERFHQLVATGHRELYLIDESVPPASHTSTRQLQALMRSVEDACLAVEPTCRSDFKVGLRSELDHHSELA